MKKLAHLVLAVALLPASVALADWQPSKPVEFVVTAGAGGGTDIFARAVQAAVQKNNLMNQPIIVTIKGGSSGAEGYVYGKSAEGDAHKLRHADDARHPAAALAALFCACEASGNAERPGTGSRVRGP